MTERKVKRWQDQRWILDSVIQAVGVEWDQPRLGYMLYPCGPDAIADFRMLGLRIRKFTDIHREFAAAAKRRERKGQSLEKEGRVVSARENYFIAALLYSAARWPIFENNEAVLRCNQQMIACYNKFVEFAPRPIERVEVPFAGKSLPGYLHFPRKPMPGEKFPCVISLDGMDASKEINCSIYGDKFLERGFANFTYDGPGQGECPIRGIYVTENNHCDAAVAVYDWLVQHPHIDEERIVISGISFGSFFGLQAAAALGDKIRGVAVAFVVHESGFDTLMNTSSPSFKLRFMYMSDYDDEEEFDRFLQNWTLLPYAGRIKAPVLIQAGEDDELSPIEFTDELIASIRTPKRFVIYEGERHAIGGGNSSSYLGEHWLTAMADWCVDRIEGKPAPNERVFIDGFGQVNAESYG
jgi:fermentation-respiration switch protein FrsA (DUF1100 family)